MLNDKHGTLDTSAYDNDSCTVVMDLQMRDRAAA